MQQQGATPNENDVFSAWRDAPEDDKPKFLTLLVKLLQQHANAVIWLRLGERHPEMVNEAVWTALDRNNGFRGESAFSTWFHGVLENLCKQELRKIIARKRTVSLDTVAEPLEEPTVVEELDKDRFIEGLNGKHRRVLELKLAGASRKEIAEYLGVNEEQVKYILKTLKGRAMEAGLGENGKG